jgi:hypothetical protein
VLVEKRPDMTAGRIDAGLVVGATVGVHQRLQQRQHGLALSAEPVEDFPFAAVRLCDHVRPPMST